MDMHLSLEQRAKDDRTSALLVNYPIKRWVHDKGDFTFEFSTTRSRKYKLDLQNGGYDLFSMARS